MPQAARGATPSAQQSTRPQPQHGNIAGTPPPHTNRTAHHNPANMPNTPPQPPSPEQAAQHFRRTNRGLPDGVRYEPLDDDTMRLLRDNGHLPPAPPQLQTDPLTGTQPQTSPLVAPQPQANPLAGVQPQTNPLVVPQPQANPLAGTQPQASPPASPNPPAPQPSAAPKTQQLTNIMEELIQDERNAHVFYSHLSKTATLKPMAEALSNIASDNTKHTQKFTHILTTQFNHNFEPAQAEINTGLEPKEALTLALEEENRSLRVLAELLEGITNAESQKTIQHVLNKKIVNYNQLERLLAMLL